MSDQHVIAWDLETVPDLDAVRRLSDLHETADESEVRDALGDGFPKLPLHKIVCIGALIAKREDAGWNVVALGAPHIGQRTEAELIASFVSRIGELRPQLISFNGNSFDLPVLRYRAMVNRVSAPGLQARPYFHRYTDDALDLCDALASYDARSKPKLDELSKILGLSGKPDGIHGGEVEGLVNAGRIQEVADYCETDVVNTYRIWLLYELFRGTMTMQQYEWSEGKLRDHAKPRIGETTRFSATHLG
jgi:predicted PolB exonuclease-like 3'-5' exonuclease